MSAFTATVVVADPAAHPTAVPVQADGLTKRFGAKVAVADLSFALRPGSVTGFLGPNGAGKTTTLRMIGGLLRPTGGQVRLFGVDARSPSARERFGYMPADPAFLAHLTGHANLDVLARLRGRDGACDRRATAAALELSAADLDREVRGYSSGMRQKLALVAAFQHRPDLVVLDEPANRLDPLAHHAFCALVRDAASAGRTVLLSSHVLAEVEEVCDSVILLRGGRLLRTATVDELRRQASRAVTIAYASAPAALPAVLTGARRVGTTVTGRIPARRPDVLRSILADPNVADVTVAPASLEEVFVDLYTEERSWPS